MDLRGATIQTDSTRWPLVMVRFVNDLTEEDFEAYLKFLDYNAARTGAARTKIALLFDCREVGRVSANIRRRQADWIRDNMEISRHNCVGFAYVFESGLVRGLLTAILWLVTMPAEYTVTSTVAEGEHWLKQKLSERGIVVNASMLAVPPRSNTRR